MLNIFGREFVIDLMFVRVEANYNVVVAVLYQTHEYSHILFIIFQFLYTENTHKNWSKLRSRNLY
jgi:hypothetical protein